MEYITYEMFGAKGDGVQDDMPCIAAAHAAANKQNLPVRAKEGAVYYLSPAACTAVIETSTDWTGATFIMDDVGCEDHQKPLFLVSSRQASFPFALSSLKAGQACIPNPTGQELYLEFFNHHHKDYIRRGLNQSPGESRRDNALLHADGSLSSPISFDFEEVSACTATPIDEVTLTLTGGTFITIANQAESKYNYHMRNIVIRRSRVDVGHIQHYVYGEGEHGAPYRGFLSVRSCAYVQIHDCLFTGHKTYWTIGSADLPVPMGSYDIDLNAAIHVKLAHCRQTNDIMDKTYWGLIGTNFCRDLTLEDCAFSRFDAHCGVTNCTLRRCRLGHQCLNAIGFGTFLVEDTEACGNAFVTLREDYGCTWQGDFILRNCTWQPLGKGRSIFHAHNDGTHHFGYACALPHRVVIDGLTIIENDAAAPDTPLSVFNNYPGADAPSPENQQFPLQEPHSVHVRHVKTQRNIQLCENPQLMQGTEFYLNLSL